MQNLTYNNLYLRFTYKTIWSLLTKFWINEVIKKKSYVKIWLTITVYNSRNKSFTLINNLPFSTNSYTDVLIVLKQVFNTSIFNDQDILNRIIFKYHFEDRSNYKRYLYITNILICISSIIILVILLFCTLIIGIEIYSIYNIEYIDKEVLNNANESLKNIVNNNECNISLKRTFFSPFIELFNADYVPSKFDNKHMNEIHVLKTISLNQEISTDTNTNCITRKLLNYYELRHQYLTKAIDDCLDLHLELRENKKSLF